MLVKLYALPDNWRLLEQQKQSGVVIRKPLGPEKHIVETWVSNAFSKAWASEIDIAMANKPVSCFVALKDLKIVGFACYDTTALGCFGPIGVHEVSRGKGTGKALLLACLLDMKLKGYSYAVVGAAGEPDFFIKTVDAMEIPDSTPGLLAGWLKSE